MIRQCEEYLFCELEKKENLCEECLETMQEPMQRCGDDVFLE